MGARQCTVFRRQGWYLGCHRGGRTTSARRILEGDGGLCLGFSIEQGCGGTVEEKQQLLSSVLPQCRPWEVYGV